MTIGQLVNGKPIEAQYEVLQRADRLFPDKCGRYYGGMLTACLVTALTDDLEAYGTKKKKRGPER